MALFSKGPSSLTLCGTLAKLSAEIRLEIWQYFMPREDDHVYPEGNLWEQYQDSPSNALAILRTNRFIYEEISYELYRNRTFGFIIDPSKDRWSPLGTRTKPGKLRHTDFRLFKKLRLDVMAPNLEDRGQVHQLRDSAIDLVCVLSGHKASLECRSRAYSTFEQQQMLHGFVYTLAKCMVPSGKMIYEAAESFFLGTLPPVELVLHDRARTIWSRNVTSQQRLDERFRDPGSTSISLYPFMLLKAFCGGSMKVSVYNTSGNLVPEGGPSIGWYLKCAPLTWDGWLAWILAEYKMSMELEVALDTLRGPTANRLRLLRFQYFSGYHSSMEDIYNMLESGDKEELKRMSEERIETYVIFERYCEAHWHWPPAGTQNGKQNDTEDDEAAQTQSLCFCLKDGIQAQGSLEGESQRDRWLTFIKQTGRAGRIGQVPVG